MTQLNINTLIFRSLISFSIIVSPLCVIKILSVSAQSQADLGVECIKKYRDYYYSGTGANLNSEDALNRAEKMCSKQNLQSSNDISIGVECIKKYRNYYYSGTGANLNSEDALNKAEKMCSKQNERQGIKARKDFRVRNDNTMNIIGIYVSLLNSSSWGSNVLKEENLPKGSSMGITFNNPSTECMEYIKAVYSDHTYDVGKFNLCEISTVVFTGNGGDRK